MKYFKLPDLGEGLPEADIVSWLIAEGDHVVTDQIIVTVETAKAIIEVPSPCDGVVAHLFGQPGDSIHTGEPLLEFVTEEGAEESGTVVGEIPNASDSSKPDTFIVGSAQSRPAEDLVQATPAVRSLAQRLNVNLQQIQGSGPHGRITPEDVQQAAKLNQQHGPAESLKGVRKQMALTMALSHQSVVPVSLFDDANINHWPAGTDITMRLIEAIAAACRAEPTLNSWFDGTSLSLRQHEKVDLGVAVDTDQGLFVPVLRNIANRSSDHLRDGLNELRKAVEARKIPPAELKGATLTLSNFGTMAGRYATPIIVPPQVTILGAGVIRKEAVVVEDQITICRVLPLSLTFDHRAVTGGEAARFMSALIHHLQQ